jgi:hypothetical protein
VKRERKYLWLILFLLLILVLIGCSDDGGIPAGSISGEVLFPGYQKGEIYVLALKAEDAGKIRQMETEAYPYLSQYVISYTALSCPGPYEIEWLSSGNYVLWSWNDVNSDSGVNHQDYAESVGWHQKKDQLFPPVSITVGAGEAVKGMDINLVSLTPYPEEDLSVMEGRGGGTLRTIKNQKVLHLWGTPEERGYACGYLLGSQIVEFLNYTLIEYFAKSIPFYENTFLPFVRTQCTVSSDRWAEIDAMLRGMRNSGSSMQLKHLGREITRDDILAQNNLYLLLMYPLRAYWPLPLGNPDGYIETVSPSCTSAVFWGPWTQNSQIEGELIHGKNNDGENDLRKMTVNSLLVMAVEPPTGSSLKRVMKVDWPGFYGTYHGINEAGLVLAAHGVPTMPNWDATNFFDYSTLYIQTLQHCSTIEDANAFWDKSNETRPAGWNSGISTPYRQGVAGHASVTYETDSFGGLIREPDYMEPDDPFSIFTTNNFFKYSGIVPKAVSILNGYHDGILSKNYRYRAMLELLESYQAESKTIGTTEVIEFLRIASNLPKYHDITEFSIIFYPNRMTLALAKEDLEKKILNAPYAQYTTFSFDEVFQ